MTDEPNIGPVTPDDVLRLMSSPELMDWYVTMLADLEVDAQAYTKEVVEGMQAAQLGVVDTTDSATEPAYAPKMPPRRRVRRSKR